MTVPDGYDLFISHATPDKPWVRTLARDLESLELRVYRDESEIRPATDFVLSLDHALGESRFLVLVLTPRALASDWVEKEWTSFVACHGPLGRVLPVMLETVETPALLASIQYLDALDQDARRVAAELAAIAGRPDDLSKDDTRRRCRPPCLTGTRQRPFFFRRQMRDADVSLEVHHESGFLMRSFFVPSGRGGVCSSGPRARCRTSIPQAMRIVFDFMLVEQLDEFFLESTICMVCLLVPNVIYDFLCLRLADRETSVALLPVERLRRPESAFSPR